MNVIGNGGKSLICKLKPIKTHNCIHSFASLWVGRKLIGPVSSQPLHPHSDYTLIDELALPDQLRGERGDDNHVRGIKTH